MLQIDPITIENLKNGAHFEYHSSTIERAKANSVINTKCTKFLTPYIANFEEEDTALKISPKNFLSDDIADINDLRSDIYKSFRRTVRAMIDFPVADVAKAAKIVNQSIKDYNIDPDAQMDLQTGLLHNLVTDLKGSLSEQVALLHLTELVEQMDEANSQFRDLMEQRNDSYAKRLVGAMRNARTKVDESYRLFIQIVNALIYLDEDEELIDFAQKQNAAISRYKQQILGQQKSTKKPDEEKKPIPETPVHEIKSVYQKEGGNPDKPLDLKRNTVIVVEGTGLKLLDSTGKLAGDILITAIWYVDPVDEKVDADQILVNTDTRIEFTMVPDLAEGQYLLRIETYYNGEGNPPLEEPNVIKFPKEITLI